MKTRAYFLLLIIFTFSIGEATSQRLSREKINDTLEKMPVFSIHRDNYFISGISTDKEISSETIPEEETQERECSTAAGQRPTQGYTGCAASRRELSSVVIKKQIEQEKT